MRARPKDRASAGALDRESEFGRHLAEAAHAALADARAALRQTASTQPEAVHALRKAFKRWRALLRLLRTSVGAPAEAMRIDARSLMRELSRARDTQGALDALDDLAKGDVPISRTSLATMRARMTALRDAAEDAAFTPELRERIGRYLDEAARSTERWNVPEVPFERIADALTVTYRRTRKLVPKHWRNAEARELHELRRRVVEHRDQMEIFQPLWPKLGRIWGKETQRLRTHLGACQDLTVLTQFIEPHQPLAPWRSHLMPAIASRHAARLRTAERVAERLFAERPKAFRKRIAALWEERESRKKSAG